MTSIRPTTLAMLTCLLLACDSGKSDGKSETPPAASKPAEAAKGDDGAAKDDGAAEARTDWAKQALTKTDDTLDGVAFSVELPAGLTREEKPGTYVTWKGSNPFEDPTFTVQAIAIAPKDLEAAAKQASSVPQPGEVVRKEDLAGGGYLVSFVEGTKQYVKVQAWRTSASGKTLTIKLGHRASAPIEGLDELRGWMETIAMSLTVP